MSERRRTLRGGPDPGRWWRWKRDLLPNGHLLGDDAWAARHRFVLILLWGHAVALPLLGAATGVPLPHVVGESGAVALCAIAASARRLGRNIRSVAATAGLITASAVVVHFSGGFIEAHFHFFVMLGVVTLYQSWTPFLLALGYVILHHGVVGMLVPDAVYNHPAARAEPWKWALVHGGFVLAASVTYLLAWRMTEQQALHDALTRLPNRLLFRDRLVQALARTARRGFATTLVLVDLDDFKRVNDTRGHPVGDELLVAVAAALRCGVRDEDTVARMGGDEFAIVLEDLKDDAAVRTAVHRVLNALGAPFDLAGQPHRIRASLGAAWTDRPVETERIVRAADEALYAAKSRGKGGYVIERIEPPADTARPITDAPALASPTSG